MTKKGENRVIYFLRKNILRWCVAVRDECQDDTERAGCEHDDGCRSVDQRTAAEASTDVQQVREPTGLC